MYMESYSKNFFTDFRKNLRVTEGVTLMMSDTSTITRYKHVQEITMGDVKKLKLNYEIIFLT